jgi:WD40 repeat protein
VFSLIKQSTAQNTEFLPNDLETIAGSNTDVIEQLAVTAPDGADLRGTNNIELQSLAEAPPGSRHWITSVAFNPSGNQIIAGSYDTSVRIWKMATGERLLTLLGHQEMVNDVAYSPNGLLLASCSGAYLWYEDFSVRLWDAQTGAQLSTFQGHADEVVSISFSPDSGRIASASFDGTIRIWSIESGNQLTVIETGSDWLRSVDFDATGHILLSAGSDSSVKMWDT